MKRDSLECSYPSLYKQDTTDGFIIAAWDMVTCSRLCDWEAYDNEGQWKRPPNNLLPCDGVFY